MPLSIPATQKRRRPRAEVDLSVEATAQETRQSLVPFLPAEPLSTCDWEQFRPQLFEYRSRHNGKESDRRS